METTTPDHIPAELVIDYDQHDDAGAPGLHQLFAELRTDKPIAWTPHNGGHWIVTRYADVQYVSKHPELFSSENAMIPAVPKFRPLRPLESDPAEHQAYRKIMSPIFSPGQAAKLEDSIRALTNKLIDGFADTGRCEFMGEFANPLQHQFFMAFMDWPMSDAPQFVTWADRFLRGVPGGSEEESTQARVEAAFGFYGYFAERVSESMSNPGDDVTGQLVQAKYDGERAMEADEIVDLLFTLLLGGVHTVPGTIGLWIIELAKRPELRNWLTEHPEQTRSAVEELLRWESVIQTPRTVTQPLEVSGVHMEPGDRLLIAYASSSRDDAEFPNPDQLDLTRHPNRHLAFGGGPHRCVGSHLARLELRVALEEMQRRLPDYRLIDDDPPHVHAGQIRGVWSLPLEFTPA